VPRITFATGFGENAVSALSIETDDAASFSLSVFPSSSTGGRKEFGSHHAGTLEARGTADIDKQ
jgi:hypothetical protein